MTSTIPTPTSLDAVPGAVEAELRAFFDDAVPAAAAIAPVVGEAAELIREFVLRGGKRIRPVFAFAGWPCGTSSSDRAVGAAAEDAAPGTSSKIGLDCTIPISPKFIRSHFDRSTVFQVRLQRQV